MSEQKLAFNGVPTEPDVRALKVAFPSEVLVIGYSISFDNAGKVFDCSPDSSRFSTVTDKWRREVERETGKVIGAPGDKTFKVLCANEIANKSHRKTISAYKCTKRALDLSTKVDVTQITSDEKRRLEHDRSFNGNVIAAYQASSKARLPFLGNKRISS